MPEFDSSLEYKNIPGFDDYRIGTDGSVWSRKRKNISKFSEYPCWKKIKPTMSRGKNNKIGYPHFNLYRNNKRYTGHIHVLMLLTFKCQKMKAKS